MVCNSTMVGVLGGKSKPYQAMPVMPPSDIFSCSSTSYCSLIVRFLSSPDIECAHAHSITTVLDDISVLKVVNVQSHQKINHSDYNKVLEDRLAKAVPIFT